MSEIKVGDVVEVMYLLFEDCYKVKVKLAFWGNLTCQYKSKWVTILENDDKEYVVILNNNNEFVQLWWKGELMDYDDPREFTFDIITDENRSECIQYYERENVSPPQRLRVLLDKRNSGAQFTIYDSIVRYTMVKGIEFKMEDDQPVILIEVGYPNPDQAISRIKAILPPICRNYTKFWYIPTGEPVFVKG